MKSSLIPSSTGPRFGLLPDSPCCLAVIGIYGIVSYAVVQRTKEMGIRMALGRTPVQLRGMLLQQGMLMVMAGAIPGIVGAQLSGRLLESLVDGAKPCWAGDVCQLGFAVRGSGIGEHLVRHPPHCHARHHGHPVQRIGEVGNASTAQAHDIYGVFYSSNIGSRRGSCDCFRPLTCALSIA